MQQVYPCPNCGNPVQYGLSQCESCGAPLVWAEQIGYPPVQPPQSTQARKAVSTGSRSGGNAARVTFLVLLFIILAGAAGIIAYGQLMPLPVISNVTATQITGTTAIIAWQTDIPSTSQVEYGTSGQYSLITVADEGLATTHSVLLQNLYPNLAYYCRARSRSANWNDAISSGITFTTPAKAGGQ
jgi:hypothetical protein